MRLFDFFKRSHGFFKTLKESALSFDSPRQEKRPWWLWLNVWSLDAPVIAVGWQWLLFQAVGGEVRGVPSVLLFLTTWLVYAGDRWLDRFSHPEVDTPRHRFHAEHGILFFVGMVFVFPLVLWLAFSFLSFQERAAGLVLASGVGIYLIAVHFLPIRKRFPEVKVMAVALFFATSCALFPLLEVLTWQALPWVEWMGLVALCWVNCQAIAHWEKEGQGERVFRGYSMGWFFVGWPLLAGSVGLMRGANGWPSLNVGVALLLSCFLFELLFRFPPLSRDKCCVIADALLLTPYGVIALNAF